MIVYKSLKDLEEIFKLVIKQMEEEKTCSKEKY